MARESGLVGAVVLAAGEGRRFGGAKLTMPFGDSTVIGRVVCALEQAGASPIVVVVGAERDEILSALSDRAKLIVDNPDPSRGMVSSVRLGVAQLPEGVERFVIALGDQPRVESADIRRLLEQQADTGKGIAIPLHAGKRGHPVALAARYRQEILALGDRQTLRDVIHAHHDDIIEIKFTSDAFVRDIDTQEQYDDELQRAGYERQPGHLRRDR